MDDFISPKLRVVTTYSRGRSFVATSPSVLQSSPCAPASARTGSAQRNKNSRNICIKRGELILKERPVVATLISNRHSHIFGRHRVFEGSAYVQFIVDTARAVDEDAAAFEKVNALCCNLNKRNKYDIDSIRRVSAIVYNKVRPKRLEIESLIDRLQSNAFGITDSEMNVIGYGLYATAATINHSCEPNCIQYFEGDVLHVRSIRDILQGEEATIAYIDVAEPRHSRQEELLRTYAFHCSCPRCSVLDCYGSYKCKTPSCRGALGLSPAFTAAQYRKWLQGAIGGVNTTTESTLLSPQYGINEEAIKFIRYFPLDINKQFITFCGDCFIPVEYKTDIGVLPHNLQLVCNTCDKSTALSTVCTDTNRLFQLWKKLREEETLSSLRKYLEAVGSVVHTRTYLYMDAASRTALALINARQFQEALEINMTCIDSFRDLYPRYFPVVSIQEFQVAKLLAFCGDRHRAREYLLAAIESLRIALGPSNQLTIEAESFVTTL